MPEDLDLTPEEFEDLLGRLDNLDPLMKQLGALAMAESQRAFSDQRFGDVDWPARYNGQGKPFINIAGALADLKKSPNVKDRRYEKRPALTDTGHLFRSITFRIVDGGTFEVGSTVEYAQAHHKGEVVEQQITQAARENLAEARRRETDPEKAGALARMTFINEQDTLETELIARPFVGITDRLRPKMIATTEAYIAGKAI